MNAEKHPFGDPSRLLEFDLTIGCSGRLTGDSLRCRSGRRMSSAADPVFQALQGESQ